MGITKSKDKSVSDEECDYQRFSKYEFENRPRRRLKPQNKTCAIPISNKSFY